jgi:hypothetical protein
MGEGGMRGIPFIILFLKVGCKIYCRKLEMGGGGEGRWQYFSKF